MKVDIKELQDFVETTYQDLHQDDLEEMRRILAFYDTAGKITEKLFQYQLKAEEVDRKRLEAALIQHLVSFIGLLSYYDFDIDSMFDAIADLLISQLEGGNDGEA